MHAWLGKYCGEEGTGPHVAHSPGGKKCRASTTQCEKCYNGGHIEEGTTSDDPT